MSFIEIEYRESATSNSMPELQSHDYYEIYFLLEGVRDIFIEDKVYTVTAPSVFVIPPFIMHKSAGGSYKRINVYVSSDYLDSQDEKLLNEFYKASPLLLKEHNMDVAVSLLEAVARITPTPDAMHLSATIKTLILLLRSSPIESVEYISRSIISPKNDTFVMEVVSYLNEHYSEKITLDKLTEIFFISRSTLCARFYSTMHCSVMEYTQALKLNRSKTLLRSTRLSIQEISSICGYSSPNYFSLIFKKRWDYPLLDTERKND